ncbi:MAG: DUF502 domain-containing protein [candidate division Zixibacteria bacterium]|nr:DUF502 domain-containing protein [candidate division Zixibacteria bacterium]
MDEQAPPAPSLGRQILKSIRRTFVSGVLVTVPVIVTLFVLNFLFQEIDGILSPLFKRFLGYSVPGMGLVATVLVVLIVGLLVRNVVGSRLFGFGELLFVRTPLVRTVYSAAKQLLETVAHPSRREFSRPVMIEYPRAGMYSLGFASSRVRVREGESTEELIAVFVPATPAPITGYVVLVPAKDIRELTISAEEAIKYIVSGGFASPPEMTKTATLTGT